MSIFGDGAYQLFLWILLGGSLLAGAGYWALWTVRPAYRSAVGPVYLLLGMCLAALVIWLALGWSLELVIPVLSD